MAVVIDPKDVRAFLNYAAEENLEAVEVATVTEEPRLVLEWRGKEIVNISRAFLDTNGAHQETSVLVDIPSKEDSYLKSSKIEDVRGKWLKVLSTLTSVHRKVLLKDLMVQSEPVLYTCHLAASISLQRHRQW